VYVGITLICLGGGVYATAFNLSSGAAAKPGDLAGAAQDGILWQSFSPGKVEQLQAEGKRVFLDFTAAWCLSCLVNERVALSSEEVENRFDELGIVPIKADWTHKNADITRELARFGRSGVPFYVLYDNIPGSEPIILPEVLTPSIVLDALDQLAQH